MCNKKTWFNFQEILNLYPLVTPSFPHRSSNTVNWFTSMLSAAGLSFEVMGLNENIPNTEINNIVNALMNNVYNRNAFNYLYYKKGLSNESLELDVTDFEKAMLPVINILNLTLPKYIPLLQATEKASENLIAPNKSQSYATARFNDTPQNGGIYADDVHTTNLGENESSQELDIGTLMSRLEETYKGFRSILLDWTNEFTRCFLLESQI